MHMHVFNVFVVRLKLDEYIIHRKIKYMSPQLPKKFKTHMYIQQNLNLFDIKIKESGIISDLYQTLSPYTSHSRPKASVELHNN